MHMHGAVNPLFTHNGLHCASVTLLNVLSSLIKGKDWAFSGASQWSVTTHAALTHMDTCKHSMCPRIHIQTHTHAHTDAHTHTHTHTGKGWQTSVSTHASCRSMDSPFPLVQTLRGFKAKHNSEYTHTHTHTHNYTCIQLHKYTHTQTNIIC